MKSSALQRRPSGPPCSRDPLPDPVSFLSHAIGHILVGPLDPCESPLQAAVAILRDAYVCYLAEQPSERPKRPVARKTGYWLSVSEAAQILSVSPRRVRQLIEAGKLEAKQIHSRLLVVKRSGVNHHRPVVTGL